MTDFNLLSLEHWRSLFWRLVYRIFHPNKFDRLPLFHDYPDEDTPVLTVTPGLHICGTTMDVQITDAKKGDETVAWMICGFCPLCHKLSGSIFLQHDKPVPDEDYFIDYSLRTKV